MEPTRATLLRKLGTFGNEAWEEFFRLYAVCIMRYARKLGLNSQDAEDVLQETMVALMRTLPTFKYDPAIGKFRSYLLKIVLTKCLAAKARALPCGTIAQDARGMSDGGVAFDMPQTEAEPMADGIDQCWEESIREEALRRVMADSSLEERTLQIFRAYVLDKKSPAQITAEFGISENAVYQVKNRLIKRIREDIQTMLAGAPIAGATP
jgi:RNA polymerase sigma-70 factor (ECF subfamily)